MADKKTNGAAAPEGAEAAANEDKKQAGILPISINAQYIKDLSMENPNAPMSLRPSANPPQVNMHVDVQARKIEGDDIAPETFEVALSTKAEAKDGDDVSFIVELTYAGMMNLEQVPVEHRNAVLLIEGPRMLFPFARAIIANATREAGFPPLMINPIDFADLYRRQMQAHAAKIEEGKADTKETADA